MRIVYLKLKSFAIGKQFAWKSQGKLIEIRRGKILVPWNKAINLDCHSKNEEYTSISLSFWLLSSVVDKRNDNCRKRLLFTPMSRCYAPVLQKARIFNNPARAYGASRCYSPGDPQGDNYHHQCRVKNSLWLQVFHHATIVSLAPITLAILKCKL